jgi:membrane protein YdbS with pleckstrin-like domain
MPEKQIVLQPDQKHFFWWFLAGIILIPFFGIGIYIIYKKKRELSAIQYQITDQTITAADSSYTQKIDIVNIIDVSVQQRWIDKKFSLGNILIQTDSRSVTLSGMKNPRKVADLIMQAAEAERLRLENLNQTKQKTKTDKPVSTDKLDYLTGLWQQGLLSNEDFEKERKHFEG